MGEPEEFPMIEYCDVREYERERAESYRGAALIGYGALQAFNSTGRFNLVLETMEKILWPDLPSPP